MKALVQPLSDRKLSDLSGVGRSIEANLHQLDIQSVAELAAADGHDLYVRLAQMEGRRQDPCVLDTFRCAVAQARDASLPMEKRNWWWWSRQRKSGVLSS